MVAEKLNDVHTDINIPVPEPVYPGGEEVAIDWQIMNHSNAYNLQRHSCQAQCY